VIRYNLVCDKRHEFESWFQDSAAYDKQAKRGLVSCPLCGSSKVEKAIMAPRLARKEKRGAINVTNETEAPAPAANAPVAMISPQEQEFRAKLKELRDHLVANADNVGKKFPEVQDALRRDRASLDLRRGFAAGRQGAFRGGDRVPPAPGPAGRAELALIIPGPAAGRNLESITTDIARQQGFAVMDSDGAQMAPTLSWQFWAVLSALFAALTAIFAKIGVENVNSDFATFIRTIVILFCLAAILAATGQFQAPGTVSSRTYAFLVLSGLATGASWICYFRALKLGDAAQVAPIDKLSVVLVAIFAFLFLGERPSGTNWIGIALIAVGAILVAKK